MAYISQAEKKEIHEQLKPILKKYNVKGTLAVKHHSTLVLTLQEGSIDFFSDVIDGWSGADYIDVNPYHYQRHFQGKSLEFLDEAIDVLNNGNWDNSDVMSDYINVGWYITVRIGTFLNPYKIVLPKGGLLR